MGLPKVWRARANILAHWKMLTLLSILGMTGFSVFSFVALHSTEAINGTLIQGTLPIVVLVASWLIYRRAINGRQVAGIVVALVGLTAIITRGNPGSLAEIGLNAGDFVFWLGVFCYGVFTVLLPHRPQSLDLICFLTVIFLIGSITTLPFHIGEIMAVEAMPMNWTAF